MVFFSVVCVVVERADFDTNITMTHMLICFGGVVLLHYLV